LYDEIYFHFIFQLLSLLFYYIIFSTLHRSDSPPPLLAAFFMRLRLLLLFAMFCSSDGSGDSECKREQHKY
jgi:hypothetical protein